MIIEVKRTIAEPHTAVPRSIAFQAKAIADDNLELLAMYGTSHADARDNLLRELKKINNEIEEVLLCELIRKEAAKYKDRTNEIRR